MWWQKLLEIYKEHWKILTVLGVTLASMLLIPVFVTGFGLLPLSVAIFIPTITFMFTMALLFAYSTLRSFDKRYNDKNVWAEEPNCAAESKNGLIKDALSIFYMHWRLMGFVAITAILSVGIFEIVAFVKSALVMSFLITVIPTLAFPPAAVIPVIGAALFVGMILLGVAGMLLYQFYCHVDDTINPGNPWNSANNVDSRPAIIIKQPLQSVQNSMHSLNGSDGDNDNQSANQLLGSDQTSPKPERRCCS